MATPKRSAPATTAPKRARTSTKSKTSKTAETKRTAASGAEFVCPECGRTFGRAAALGAHRSRAHGVAGQSAQAQKSRQARQSSVSAATGRGTSAQRRSSANATASKQGRTRAKTVDGDGAIDRNTLL